MSREPVDVAAAIRKLRQTCSLTQVQLAIELGIAPGSVYRYEAGTSRPNLGVLHNLWNFALKHNAPYAASEFSEALTDLAGTPFTFEQDTREQQKLVDASMARLRPHEQHIVIALIQMLRTGNDDTALRVIKAALDPWMGTANEELKKYLEKTTYKKQLDPEPKTERSRPSKK